MKTPFSKDIGLEGYAANPFLPSKFVVGDNEKAVASVLVPLWLTRFTSDNVVPDVRLETYQIDSLEVTPWQQNRFKAYAKVSVKPLKGSFDVWQLGTAKVADDWIRGVSLCYELSKQGEDYKIEKVCLDDEASA